MQRKFPREKGEYSAQLGHLSSVLLSLHKRLLDTTREQYTAKFGGADNPFRILELVMSDPYFAWLRPVSQLIVQIDELADAAHQKDDVRRVAAATRSLFGTGEFAERYPELLQMDADLVILHAQLQKALKVLEEG